VKTKRARRTDLRVRREEVASLFSDVFLLLMRRYQRRISFFRPCSTPQLFS
jgi:hypothetical protein